MRTSRLFRTLVVVGCFASMSLPALATDVDGPDDCQRSHDDWGDAPECIPAYPSGVTGQFPTCTNSCGVGTQELNAVCPPRSTAPGPTGFIRHIQDVGGYWLGCYSVPGGVLGIDNEIDGKTNTPAIGFSACGPVPGIATDCIEPAFGMTFDQDECYADGSDAGIKSPITFITCNTSLVNFEVYTCQGRNVFLNICVDWNEDGDWNDVFLCPAGCAYEWAVKNATLALNTGCNALVSPPFLVGPRAGYGWLRITVTDQPVPDDYPWNGSAGIAAAPIFHGGETEDYPVRIDGPTSTKTGTWGRIKSIYR